MGTVSSFFCRFSAEINGNTVLLLLGGLTIIELTGILGLFSGFWIFYGTATVGCFGSGFLGVGSLLVTVASSAIAVLGLPFCNYASLACDLSYFFLIDLH